jgi:hypothetical protein
VHAQADNNSPQQAKASASANESTSADDSSQSSPSPGPLQSPSDLAEQQLKKQEKQRVMGVIPTFNVSDVPDAVPLSPSQKFSLFFRSARDPFQFLAAGITGGINQAENNFSGYGQGAQGYFKRFGASYTDSVDGNFWGNAVYPILLHEDPRYFRKGTGSFKSRFLYAISTTVWSKRDNGTWGPNYGNVLGNLTAGGISNLYYPSSDRGLGLTLQGAFTVTAQGALGVVLVEFWPDIAHKFLHKKEQR